MRNNNLYRLENVKVLISDGERSCIERLIVFIYLYIFIYKVFLFTILKFLLIDLITYTHTHIISMKWQSISFRKLWFVGCYSDRRTIELRSASRSDCEGGLNNLQEHSLSKSGLGKSIAGLLDLWWTHFYVHSFNNINGSSAWHIVGNRDTVVACQELMVKEAPLLASRYISRINGNTKRTGAIRRIVFYICYLCPCYICDNIKEENREHLLWFGGGRLSKEWSVNLGQENEYESGAMSRVERRMLQGGAACKGCGVGEQMLYPGMESTVRVGSSEWDEEWGDEGTVEYWWLHTACTPSLSLQDPYLAPRRRVSPTRFSVSRFPLCTKTENWVTCLGKEAPARDS